MKPDTKQIESVRVFRRDRFIGTLSRTELGCRFEYDKSAVHELCFAMPIAKEFYQFDGANLFPFFANLLPEGSRINALATQAKTSTDDLFSMLLLVAENLIGDVELDLPKELKTAPVEFKNWSELRNRVQDIAGVQEKMSGRLAPIAGRKRGRDFLVKLSNPNFPRLVENEKFFLDLATKCGLRSASASVQKDQTGETALIVERFDRKSGKRFRQEDGCQIANVFPADKYRLQFHKLIEQMANVCASPVLAKHVFIKQYLFAYLTGNGDQHAKNLSVLESAKTGNIEPSPIYDALTTLAYPKLDQNMALAIYGKTNRFRRSNFLSLAESAGIPGGIIDKDIDQMCPIIIDSIPDIVTVFEDKIAATVETEIRQRIDLLQ